jgi:GAF domain-containing protein
MVPTTIRLDDNGGQERMTARKRGLYESRREREFYSYYESVLAYANTEPKFCDLHSPAAVAAHRAITSSDTTLTASVQLVALQIGTRRAMIFFFDAEYAYIIAESTRTLSLQDDSQHGPDDSLWLGFTKIPRGFSVCEVTADLPVNEGSNAQDSYSTSIAHIINDLTKDTRFCDRPYVEDGPKARFYAGVPITTPRGINIGALCVLDDKPRDGLEPSQVEFLRSMASTVMSHLELVLSKRQQPALR